MFPNHPRPHPRHGRADATGIARLRAGIEAEMAVASRQDHWQHPL